MIKIGGKPYYYKLNDKGEFIKKIQYILKSIGYKIDIDGIYGLNTYEAIIDFQRNNHLIIDGIIGPDAMYQLLLKAGYKKEEAFINSVDFYSETENIIWVDTYRNLLHIFKGKNRNYQLIKTFIAATGSLLMPTIKGLFKTKVKGKQFGNHKGYIAKWYTQIKDNYLIHSILYNFDESIYDGRLGMNITDGCIRVSLDNAKYIYDKILENTTVYIS